MMGLSDHHTQDIVVIATRTVGVVPLEETVRHLEKVCLEQREPLSIVDKESLERIWQNLLNILTDDKVLTTIRLRNRPNLTDKIYSLKEAAWHLKKVCLEQRKPLNIDPLNINGERLERIRQNLLGIFMEDGKGNKTITTLLFYNGPNLTEIYSLKETAQYLRKARLGQRSPLSVNEKRLEQIRQDLLDILVDSEAATSLLFYNGPDLTGLCSLVLNAAQSPDSIIAPRIEVPVPQQTGGG